MIILMNLGLVWHVECMEEINACKVGWKTWRTHRWNIKMDLKETG
jgi:hypothetical protein